MGFPENACVFGVFKNERWLTKVRQSKFFFKTLENTIKYKIPYKKSRALPNKCERALFCYFSFQGCKQNICLRSETA